MKSLIFPVCFAATAAVAAELKDHTQVARDWQENAAPPSRALTEDLSLRGTIAATGSAPSANELRRHFQSNPSRDMPFPRQRFDAPSEPARPDNLPPGAKPYQFEGRTYWLIPLAAPIVS